MQDMLSRDRICFAATSAATFLLLGATCYAAYGDPFLQETYLYHSGRKDPRHNFSIYFYNSYLTYELRDKVSWYALVHLILKVNSESSLCPRKVSVPASFLNKLMMQL